MPIEYCFCFVSQSGRLEVQSIFLAASLARNVRCSYEMIAAIPTQFGALDDVTLEYLNHLRVKTVSITNKVSPQYKIGNKLSCLETACKIARAKYIVFLDTDILCNKEFSGVKDIEKYDLSMRVAGKAKWWANENEWKPLYEMFGLTLPRERLISAFDGQKMLPYFNAGFIAIHSNSPFPKLWIKVAQQIYEQCYNTETEKKFNTDQLAIPITLRMLNMSYQCLDTRYNSTPKTIKSAIFQHYHSITKLFDNSAERYPLLSEIILKYPALNELVQQKCRTAIPDVLLGSNLG